MFDANASHIKIGQKFFVEIHSTDQILDGHGVEIGDILLCEHVEKGGDFLNRNLLSKLWAGGDSDWFEWAPSGESDWSWMVYSGRPDGTGFINDKWKTKALKFLGGNWDDQPHTLTNTGKEI